MEKCKIFRHLNTKEGCENQEAEINEWLEGGKGEIIVMDRLQSLADGFIVTTIFYTPKFQSLRLKEGY